MNLPLGVWIVAILTVTLMGPLFGLMLLRSVWATPKVKRACCRIGWHSPARMWLFLEFDGASAHAQCPWCGYKGMIDSQENLF